MVAGEMYGRQGWTIAKWLLCTQVFEARSEKEYQYGYRLNAEQRNTG